MADNILATPGTGATVRTYDNGTAESPAAIIEYVTGGSAGAWTMQYVALATGLPVQPGTSTIWRVDNAGTFAVQAVCTNAGTFAVQAVCTNGGTFVVQENGGALTALQLIDDVIATLGTTTYAEATTKGAIIGAVRKDSGGTLAGTDNEIAPLQLDANGYLRVNVAAGGGSGGTAMTDDAAFTAATTSFTPVGGIVTADSVDSGDGGAFAMLANRQQKVTLYDSGGVELAVGGGTQYTEDAAAAANPVGNAINLVRTDTPATNTVTGDGDNIALRGSSSGAAYVELTSGAIRSTILDLTNSNPLTVAVVDSNGDQITVSSDATHDSAVAAVGPQTMARASAAAPANVSADNDAVQVWALQNGSIVSNLAVGGTLVTGSAGLPVAQQGTFTVGLSAAQTLATVTTVSTVTTCSTVTTVGTLTNITNWGNVADDAAFTPTTTRVSMSGFFADETGTDSVDEGDGGAARMTLDRKIIVNPQPHTAGGCAIFRSLDLDETEEEVKGTAGQVYGMLLTNTSTGTRWLKFYNATAANVTVGTTTPVLTWGIPGNSSDDIGAAVFGAHGLAFDTAITVAVTTALADADTGAPGANDVIINVFYK
jgi:hypothetical protein